MGICKSCCNKPQNNKEKNKSKYTKENSITNIYNQPINESICEINSKSGGKGIGFLCRIQFKINIYALITSNNILNKGDLISGENILVYFKNNDKYINLIIDNTRKCYSSEVYQITIIEIIPKDNVNFITYLDIDFYRNQNEIKILYYGNNNKEEQYLGNIINYNNNAFQFALYYNDDNSLLSPGCPILNSKDNKVIGINTTLKGNNCKTGTFIFQAINDFYQNCFVANKYKINIYFFDLDNNNKKYTIKIKDINIMFGELIVYFYIISGLEFNDNYIFFYNNLEIPSYSTNNLSNLNIRNNSQIFFKKRTSQIEIGMKLNIIFDLTNGEKILVIADPNMLVKQLLLKFCQRFKHLYHHVLQNYKITFHGRTISPDDGNLLSIGLVDYSQIIVCKTN